ncbi:MAG: L-seryl-tRNA(Sec) selenium transferase [Desulforhabdus sp.]|nr:L-seryl-tRNA(Sec) selenium transferase [Desulforhabdus sp.]
MSTSTVKEILRRLPAVDSLLQDASIQAALDRHPRKLVLQSIRQVLAEKRNLILENPETAQEVNLTPDHLMESIQTVLEKLSDYTLVKVVNSTGIVIHTNLGRSLLPEQAVDRLQAMCHTYNNLEYDLEKGQRGSRYVHAEAILCEITGSEAALVVNNNAGAVFLVLNTLAKNREVIVSRGQLVEIGGSFRIPDVMRSSGAILREVGCTNRTHLRDYGSAIGEQTALLMKVHCSNYRIIGFTAEVSLQDLVLLGREYGLPVMEDLGSGCFVDLAQFGLEGEPTVQEALQSGADVVTFSGDKLLGGPQAGIILGRKHLIARCKKNPLTRALRVDKMTLAALEATLRLYRDEAKALEDIPTLRMISVPLTTLEERAHHLATLLKESDGPDGMRIEVLQSLSQVGGGSLPGQYLPTFVVALSSSDMSTKKIESTLRSNKPPIIGRIESDQFLLDVRTIQFEEFPIIQQAFADML